MTMSPRTMTVITALSFDSRLNFLLRTPTLQFRHCVSVITESVFLDSNKQYDTVLFLGEA